MKFHEKRFAREYDTRLSAENYPGILLNKVSEKMENNSTVIDCGAGSGFFSIPLAGLGYRITAVEPSSAMLNIFKEKLIKSTPDRSAGNNITIVNQSWEEYTGRGADYCICVHAIYPMSDPKQALLKMHELCETTVLIARDMELPSFTISERIREKLNLQSSCKRNTVDVSHFLHLLDMTYRAEKIVQKRLSKFSDLDREAEYYTYHLKLPQSSVNQVKEVLEDLAAATEKGYEIEQVYHDIIYIF